MCLDLENAQSIRAFVNDIAQLEVDVLINNAGVLLESGEEKVITTETLRKTFNVNLFGTIELTELVKDQLVPGAHIVNITSSWGSYSSEDLDHRFPAYRMSKAALNMYSKSLSKRLEITSVKVINYDPGWVKTEMGGPNANKEPEHVAADLYELIVG